RRSSDLSLERWRSVGIGPKFLKLCGRVIYRQVDIEAYEGSCLHISTSESAVVAHGQTNADGQTLDRCAGGGRLAQEHGTRALGQSRSNVEVSTKPGASRASETRDGQ